MTARALAPGLAEILDDPPDVPDGGGRVPDEGGSFARQWEYVTSAARFNLVLCGRRSGKTHGARLRARRRLARPGAKVLYVTLIRRNCRKLFWRPILAELRDAGWECDANEVDMICRLPNGSTLEATGCDDVRGAAKIRGDYYDLVIIDEAQEPNDDVLEPLVEEVLIPLLVDRGGDLDLLGTPPDSMAGYFVDRLSDERWKRFGWSMWDNRFIPREEIQKLIDAKGLTEDHPVYRREFLGLPEVDPEKLVYEYRKERNHFDMAALVRGGRDDGWRYAMGLDLGFQDSDAIVVVGWKREDADRRLYVVHQWAENHQDVDALADVVAEVIREFRPSIIVGDHGGHGAVKVLETLKARMGIAIQTKPTDVNVSIGLVNDDLRCGRLMVPFGTPLEKDMRLVTWTVDPTTKRKVANKKGYHSDLTEALRYAHHGSRHYAAKPPKPAETTDERRMRQWREQQRREANPWR